MVSYSKAAMERAMKVQEVILRAMATAHGVRTFVDHRARHKRQDAGAGWTLLGLKRATRRLLPDRCARSRCRAVLGSPLPGRRSWCRRGTPTLARIGVSCGAS
jgi:hypothetical protein